MNRQATNWEKIFAIHPERIVKQPNFNMDNRLEKTFPKGTFMNSQQVHENVLNSISHWANANESHNETPVHTHPAEPPEQLHCE